MHPQGRRDPEQLPSRRPFAAKRRGAERIAPSPRVFLTEHAHRPRIPTGRLADPGPALGPTPVTIVV